MVLGIVKLLLGLFLGSSLAELFRAFPQPLLGSLLIFSGAPLETHIPCGAAKIDCEVQSVLMLCSFTEI